MLVAFDGEKSREEMNVRTGEGEDVEKSRESLERTMRMAVGGGKMTECVLIIHTIFTKRLNNRSQRRRHEDN
jgi:hypothetical protein